MRLQAEVCSRPVNHFQVDPRTVYLLTAMIGGVMSAVLFALRRSFPPAVRGLGHWATALLVLFFGGAFASTIGLVPVFFPVLVGNGLIWGGLYLLLRGSQLFFGKTPQDAPWLAGIGLAILAVAWFTWGDANYAARIRVATAIVLALVWGQLRLVSQATHDNKTLGRSLALAVLTAMAVAQVFRFASSFLMPIGDSNLNVSPAHLIFISVWTFSMLLFSVALVLLATERLREELELLATRDSLTNALTRRSMNEACQREMDRSQRNGRPLSMLLVDLDHFKQINDRHGHLEGDRVLVRFAQQVTSILRKPDSFGRFGGEEFILLLPETNLHDAQLVAERIRAMAADAAQPFCTVSIGVATLNAGETLFESLLARADQGVYLAKTNGRNRVEFIALPVAAPAEII